MQNWWEVPPRQAHHPSVCQKHRLHSIPTPLAFEDDNHLLHIASRVITLRRQFPTRSIWCLQDLWDMLQHLSTKHHATLQPSPYMCFIVILLYFMFAHVEISYAQEKHITLHLKLYNMQTMAAKRNQCMILQVAVILYYNL